MDPIDLSRVIRSRDDAQISVDENLDTATTLLALPIRCIVISAHVAKAARPYTEILILVSFTLYRCALCMSEYESKDANKNSDDSPVFRYTKLP